MNLILLLSALLSALGGGAGVRVPATPAALSRSLVTAAQATAAARAQVAARPVQAVGGPATSVAPVFRAFALADPIPAFATRRRE